VKGSLSLAPPASSADASPSSPRKEALLVDLHKTGQKSPSDLAELFGVGRSTVYRALERAADTSPAGNAGAAPAI